MEKENKEVEIQDIDIKMASSEQEFRLIAEMENLMCYEIE